MIQVFCRWRAAESVREYNHVTPDVYADKVAAAMAVDAAQAPKGPQHVVTDDDDAMAVLQAELDDLTWAAQTLRPPHADDASACGDSKHTPAAPATAVYQRVTKAPAKATCSRARIHWPTETCPENDGQGWLAKVVCGARGGREPLLRDGTNERWKAIRERATRLATPPANVTG